MDQYSTRLGDLVLNGTYRARPNEGEEPFNHVRELWYPPPHAVKRLGRLNHPGQPLFYGANKINVAMIELRPKPGDVLTVMVARAKAGIANLKVAHVGLERSRAPELERTIREDIPRVLPSHLQFLGSHANYKKWLLIDDFLGDVFTEPVPEGAEHRYKLTVPIAELLFRIPNADGINYPSVATNLHGINLCLQPAAADRHFAPSLFYMFRVMRHVPPRGYFVYQLRRAIRVEADGTIVWGPEAPQPTIDLDSLVIPEEGS